MTGFELLRLVFQATALQIIERNFVHHNGNYSEIVMLWVIAILTVLWPPSGHKTRLTRMMSNKARKVCAF